MQNVFDLRDRLIGEYSAFSRSFTRIAAADIEAVVRESMRGSAIGLNHSYKSTQTTSAQVP